MDNTENQPNWLITRVFGSGNEPDIINILTTRGFILARHSIKAIIAAGNHVKGVRRYRTESKAHRKAGQLNVKFKTNGYGHIREDEIK
jgi:hypothetical protein